MRIGLMYGMTTYPPSTGGTIHGYQLVRQLAALGHEVSTCFYDHGPHPGLVQFRGRSAPAFLRRIDVLYLRVEWQTTSVELSLLKLLRWRRLPVVWEFNGTPHELLHQGVARPAIDAVQRRLKRWARLCDGAVAVSDDIADHIRRTLDIAEVCVIPNGSDPAAFLARPDGEALPDAPLNVCWIGTSSAGWHDLPTLLDAARKLHDAGSNVVFTIYGDPHALPPELPANVRLAGIVPYERLGGRLRDADVGVHLFRRGDAMPTVLGSPLKVFDYMASGLAVLTNCDGQQSDIVAAWNCGVRCDGSVDDLVRQISRLERDRGLCAEMGRSGRRAVVQQFNWSQVGLRTEAFLQRLRTGAPRVAPETGNVAK